MNGRRKPVGWIAVALLVSAALIGCRGGVVPKTSGGLPAPAPRADASCPLTIDDGLSPTYVPNAPARSKVGTGHVLTGRVLSARDCSPIPGATVEVWPEYPGRGHPDSARATLFADASGGYRFECDPPEHIHMRVSATGYVTIAQNSYHPDGRRTGTFDIVLAPVSR
jgi:carboxypeptidase family protein